MPSGASLFFDMSLFAAAQSNFAAAQETLAQMMGKPAGAAGNALFRFVPVTLVFGTPRPSDPMNLAGGFRPRVEVPATMTREQLATAPLENEVITRTDLAPHVTYRIATVDAHDPLHYVLTLVKVG
jgi:hypothetical protein